MSLEQAISENTAAIRDLIAKIGGVLPLSSATPAAAPAPAARTKKAETAKPAGPANAGDADGTRYFKNTKHGTFFKTAPTDPVVTLPDTVEVTGADFLAGQPVASGPASAEPSKTDTAGAADDNLFGETAKVEITSEVLTNKLRELHKLKGNSVLAPILKEAGATSVPSIPKDKYQSVFDAAVKAIAA